MPNHEDIITRAGILQTMTGLTEQEFQALLPPLRKPLWPTCTIIPLMGSLARFAATVRMTIVLNPRWLTNSS
jgi:hypothetical protein